MKKNWTLLLAAAGLTGCGGHSQESTARLPDGPPIQAALVAATITPHQATEEVVGTVRSRQQTIVEAKVAGRVEQLLAAPGQTVAKDELLVALDVREISARLDSARAMLEQADRELARYQQLVAQNAATRQELEAIEARQKVAAAQVSEVETMLSYARVTAPFDGVVTRKLSEVGDMAMPGKPLLEVESPGALQFEADLPEALIDRVKMGQSMSVRVGAAVKEAVISEIAPIADAVSRTFQVKLDLPETAGLRSGQFGRVAVPVAEERILAVPASAVLKRGQMEMVFVEREGRAWMRLVKTGRTVGGGVEILSGLEEGERILAEAPERILDGQPLEVNS
jgi:membrane fusion protein (multidrug efflux system)